MRNLSLLFCFLILLCTGCKNKETTVMTNPKRMETVCIGRLLIDIPAGFSPMMPLSGIFRAKSAGEKASTIDVNILAISATPTTFASALEKRQGEIIASARDAINILKNVISKGSDSTLFRILQIEDSYSSELHLIKDHLYLVAKVESYDGRFDEAENDLFAFAKDIIRVESLSDRQSGFCLGPVVVQGLHEAESTSVTFRSDEQPDILITIDVDTYGLDEPGTLLQRVSGPNSLLEIFDARHKVLRKGDLNVAGMHAQEWLGSVKLGENRERKQYGFAFETRRPKPAPASPRVHVELDTGQHDRNGVERPNSLTDEQAMALWDSIIVSIRLRPEPKQQ
jgi:hypothetical protein